MQGRAMPSDFYCSLQDLMAAAVMHGCFRCKTQQMITLASSLFCTFAIQFVGQVPGALPQWLPGVLVGENDGQCWLEPCLCKQARIRAALLTTHGLYGTLVLTTANEQWKLMTGGIVCGKNSGNKQPAPVRHLKAVC